MKSLSNQCDVVNSSTVKKIIKSTSYDIEHFKVIWLRSKQNISLTYACDRPCKLNKDSVF